MTRGIEEVEASPGRVAPFWADRPVRVALLLIFAAGALSVPLIGHAPQRDQAFFLQEFDAGRVTTVAYDSRGGLRWAEGDWTWYRTQLDLASLAVVQADVDGDGVPEYRQDADGDGVADGGSPDPGVEPAEQVRRALQERHRTAPGDLDRREDLDLREVGPTADGWLGWISSGPLDIAANCAWVATFLLAGLRPRRFATGWAWLPMLFFSVFGAPLYLLLEPGPLWRRGGWSPDHRRFGLGFGLLGVLLSIVVLVAISG